MRSRSNNKSPISLGKPNNQKQLLRLLHGGPHANPMAEHQRSPRPQVAASNIFKGFVLWFSLQAPKENVLTCFDFLQAVPRCSTPLLPHSSHSKPLAFNRRAHPSEAHKPRRSLLTSCPKSRGRKPLSQCF